MKMKTMIKMKITLTPYLFMQPHTHCAPRGPCGGIVHLDQGIMHLEACAPTDDVATSRCFRSAFAANYFLLVGIIPLDLYGGYIRVMSLRCT